MAKKNTQESPSTNSRQCTTSDVEQLGAALIEVADQYPTRYLTERDFFPLVVAYLHAGSLGSARSTPSSRARSTFGSAA
jgi:hypothetical protein